MRRLGEHVCAIRIRGEGGVGVVGDGGAVGGRGEVDVLG